MSTEPAPVRRLLVVVAHPDDETFGCGSLLAHAAAVGIETTVVCATRGEAGEPASHSGLRAADLPGVRAKELRTAARILGVQRVELLGWKDSGMSGEPAANALVATPTCEVAGVIGRWLAEIEPDIVVTLDASDGHRDHVHIRNATLLAVDRLPTPPRTYLHCLPRSLMAQWAEVLRQADPSSAYLAIGRLGTPDEDVTTVIDTRQHVPVRQQAMAAHASQVPPYAAMPDDLALAFLETDRLRRVVPPWEGGPIEDRL